MRDTTTRVFKKSSFSPQDRYRFCVAVSISEHDVLVTHSDGRQATLQFTPDEWKAFVAGVKASEFDNAG